MKKRFTVTSGESEYTLGSYMLMKAREKQQKAALPATVKHTKPMPLQSFLSYVNKKLTIKEAPAPEKTIKAFPFRTALSATCSALLVCTLMFSFGALNGLMPQTEGSDYIALSEQAEEEADELVMNEEK
jgi:hypothetical protein